MRSTIRERMTNTSRTSGFDDQIEIALPVARFDVGQSVPLLGQRTQRLAEQAELLHLDGQLVGLGAERAAADAGEVADVHQLEEGERVLADDVALDVGLDAVGAILEVEEGGLAEIAHRDDAPGDADGIGAVLELFAGLAAVPVPYTRRRVGGSKVVGKGINPATAQLFQLAASRRNQIGDLGFHALVPPSARGLTGMAGGVKEAELRIVDCGLRIAVEI